MSVRLVSFWMGGDRRVVRAVTSEEIEACYALPKTADRFAYWISITGDISISGHVMIWSPVEEAV